MNVGAITSVVAFFACFGAGILSFVESYAQRRFYRWAYRVGLTVVKLSREIPSPAMVGLLDSFTFQADDWQFRSSEDKTCYGRLAPTMTQAGTRGGIRLMYSIRWRDGIAEVTGMVPLSTLLFFIGLPAFFASHNLTQGGASTSFLLVLVIMIISVSTVSLWEERRRADEMLAAFEYHLRIQARMTKPTLAMDGHHGL